MAFAFGKAGADESSTTPSIFVQTLPDYWEKCDFRESTTEGVPFTFHVQNCYDYIHGIRNLRRLVTAYFEGKTVSDPTVVTYDEYETHSKVQSSILRGIIPTNVPIGQVYFSPFFTENMDVIPLEGVARTSAYGGVFDEFVDLQPIIDEWSVDVMSNGNLGRHISGQYIDPLMDDNNSFLLAAGWRIVNLHDDCEVNPNTCEPTLASFPESYGAIGSNWCTEDGEEICILAPWTDTNPSFDGYPQSSLIGGGTSISSPYTAGVLWLVSSAIKHLYEWNGGITQRQAVMMATGIVKSCAIDLDEPGPDEKTGLGLLYAGCMEDGDGLVEDPKALIDSKYMFQDIYNFPEVKRTTQTIVSVTTNSTRKVISTDETTISSTVDSDGVETREVRVTQVIEITTTVTTSTTIISPDGTETIEEEQSSSTERETLVSNKTRRICPEGKESLCGLRIRAKVFLENLLQ